MASGCSVWTASRLGGSHWRLSQGIAISGLALILACAGSTVPPVAPPTAKVPRANLGSEERELQGVQLRLEMVRRWQPGGSRSLLMDSLGPGGELLILHLWAPYCEPCREELPIFNHMFPSGENRKVDFFSVCVDQCDDDNIRAFLRKVGGPTPPLHPTYTGMAIAEQLPKLNLPTTLIVSRNDWTVRQAFVGAVTERGNELWSGIDQLQTTLDLTTHLPQQCGAPPCVKDSFFLHKRVRPRALSMWQQSGRRWQSADQLFKPGPSPVLVYLFSPDCAECQADLARLQDVSRNWARLRNLAPARLVVLAMGGSQTQLTELISRLQLSFSYGTIATTDDPELRELWLRLRRPATLLLDAQRIVRHAFIGTYESHRRRADAALDRMLAKRPPLRKADGRLGRLERATGQRCPARLARSPFSHACSQRDFSSLQRPMKRSPAVVSQV